MYWPVVPGLNYYLMTQTVKLFMHFYFGLRAKICQLWKCRWFHLLVWKYILQNLFRIQFFEV